MRRRLSWANRKRRRGRSSRSVLSGRFEVGCLDSAGRWVSRYWRRRKCLTRRNICSSSKTRRRCARPSPSSCPTAAIGSSRRNRARSAIAKLADFAFDIIITDLRLPGIDGSAVVEAAVARYPAHHRDRRHRLRHGEGRGRGDQARRVGLRQQAVSDRRTAARARLRARAAAAEVGERAICARSSRSATASRGSSARAGR